MLIPSKVFVLVAVSLQLVWVAWLFWMILKITRIV
jgi:hypothetical protein